MNGYSVDGASSGLLSEMGLRSTPRRTGNTATILSQHPCAPCYRVLESTRTDNAIRMSVRKIVLNEFTKENDAIVPAVRAIKQQMSSVNNGAVEFGSAVVAEFSVLLDAPITEEVVNDSTFSRELVDMKASSSPYSSVVLAATKIIALRTKALVSAVQAIQNAGLWADLPGSARVSINDILEQASLASTLIRCAGQAEGIVAAAALLVLRAQPRLVSAALGGKSSVLSGVTPSSKAVLSLVSGGDAETAAANVSSILHADVFLGILSTPSLAAPVICALGELVRSVTGELKDGLMDDVRRLASGAAATFFLTGRDGREVFDFDALTDEEAEALISSEWGVRSSLALQTALKATQILEHCLEAVACSRVDAKTSQTLQLPANDLANDLQAAGVLSNLAPRPPAHVQSAWPLLGRQLNSSTWGGRATAGVTVRVDLVSSSCDLLAAVSELMDSSLVPSRSFLAQRPAVGAVVGSLLSSSGSLARVALSLGASSVQGNLRDATFARACERMTASLHKCEAAIFFAPFPKSAGSDDNTPSVVIPDQLLDAGIPGSAHSAAALALTFCIAPALVNVLALEQAAVSCGRFEDSSEEASERIRLHAVLEGQILPEFKRSPLAAANDVQQFVKALVSANETSLAPPFAAFGSAVVECIVSKVEMDGPAANQDGDAVKYPRATRSEVLSLLFAVSSCTVQSVSQQQQDSQSTRSASSQLPLISKALLLALRPHPSLVWASCAGEAQALSALADKYAVQGDMTTANLMHANVASLWSLTEDLCGQAGVNMSIAAATSQSPATTAQLKSDSSLFLALSKLAAAAAGTSSGGAVDEILATRMLEAAQGQTTVAHPDLGWALRSSINSLLETATAADSQNDHDDIEGRVEEARLRALVRVEVAKYTPLVALFAGSVSPTDQLPAELVEMWLHYWALVLFVDRPLFRAMAGASGDRLDVLELLRTPISESIDEDADDVDDEEGRALRAKAMSSATGDALRGLAETRPDLLALSGQLEGGDLDLVHSLRSAARGDAAVCRVAEALVEMVKAYVAK